jgi:hypothetical protein
LPTKHHGSKGIAGLVTGCADIQGDQDPASPGSGRNDIRAGSASETFARNGIDTMARAGEGGGSRRGQVLPGLELHRDGGTGSNSSRANAAPYAAAARTPATVTVGYSAVICPAVIPAARQSKITLTGTRVPAITAWPCITRGLAEISSSCSPVTAPRACPVDHGTGSRSQIRTDARSTVPWYMSQLAPCPPVRMADDLRLYWWPASVLRSS